MKFEVPPYHRAFILSDPDQTDGEVILLRFTTYEAHKHRDMFVYTGSDYAALNHESVVSFSGAMVGPASRLQRAIDDGSFRLLEPIPGPTLKKILIEAHDTVDLSDEQKSVLASPDHPSCG